MPPPRPATEACSGSLKPARPSRAGPISQYVPSQPAGRTRRPDVRDSYRRQTDRRQTLYAHHRLMPPGRGIINKVKTEPP